MERQHWGGLERTTFAMQRLSTARDEGQRDEARDEVERQYHDTLEEVVALKQILQEFLSEPTPRTQPPESAPSRSRLPDDTTDVPQSDESLSMQPHVRASRRSEQLLRQSLHFEPNFQARMRYYMVKNQRKKDQIRAAANDKTQEELKPTPTINERSKRIHRSIHHLHAWEHEKKRRLEELREAERRRELEEVTSAPRILCASQRMHSDKEDDLTQCKVEDRLQLLGLIYEYQQEERKLEEAKRSGETGFKPRLAPRSNRLAREQNIQVYERLHEHSKHTPTTNDQDEQYSPHRRIPKSTVDAAIQRLAEIGDLYRTKRAEMAQKREQQSKELQMRTKLSTKSRVLAENARSKAREQISTCHRKCTCCLQPEQDDTPHFQAVNASQAAAIYERQLQWQKRKEQKCQQERVRREDAYVTALEFRNPQYRSAWDPLKPGNEEDHGRSDPNIGNSSSPDKVQRRQRLRTNHSFFERSTKWALEREQQLIRERHVWDEIHLRDCTFKPTLHPAPRRRENRQEAQVQTPRSVLKSINMSLDRGFFSRTHLRTPMLDTDRSDVSSDDCVDATSSGDNDPHVIYFDDGEEVVSF